MLLPVVYTPTVGEACQKFGLLPQFSRGCYVSLSDRGRVREVLEEYARAELTRGPNGELQCDCIVFSDGGRILGLGDLAAWGVLLPALSCLSRPTSRREGCSASRTRALSSRCDETSQLPRQFAHPSPLQGWVFLSASSTSTRSARASTHTARSQ